MGVQIPLASLVEQVTLESALKRPYTGIPVRVRLSVWSEGKRQSAYSLIREGQEFSASFVSKRPEKVTFTVGPYKLILPVGVQVDDGSMHVGSRVNGMFVSVYARRP